MTARFFFAFALLTALLIFSNITPVVGQNPNQKDIDSLLALLPNTELDTNRVNLLTEISWDYVYVDPTKGVEYSEQAFDLATKINWPKGRAKAMSNWGVNTFSIGAIEEAIPQLIQAVDLAQQVQDQTTIGVSAVMLGLCYNKINQNELSVQANITARDALRKVNHPFLPTAIQNLGTAYLNLAKYPETLESATEIYDYGIAKNNEFWQGKAYLLEGAAYTGMSNYPTSLQNYFEAIKLFEKNNVNSLLQECYYSIGIIYQSQQEYDKALEYYHKALTISESLGMKEKIASTLSNIGSVYDLRKEREEARSYYTQALEIFEEIGNRKSIARTIYNIGGIYLLARDYAETFTWFDRALDVARLDSNFFQTSVILGLTGEAYRGMAVTNDSIALMKYFNGDRIAAFERALVYTDSAITMLTAQSEITNRSFYLLQKSKIQTSLNHYQDALESYKEHVTLQDSIFNIERDKKFVQAEMNYEFSRREDSLNLASTKQKLELQNKIELQALAFQYDAKQAAAQSEKEKQELAFEEALKRQQIENEYARKQAEAEALNQQRELERKQAEALNKAELKRQRNIRNSTLLGSSGLLLFLIVVVRQRNKVRKEKARSEELLLNILPAEIAEELKAKGKADARDFEMVTILFTDFKGFTQMSAKLTASDLVNEINHCFKAFDGIMGKYGIEKIKTIGDSYMAAGGIPAPNEKSTENTVLAALEMQAFIRHRKADLDAKGLPAFEMRAGIHTGPIVAGIVGVKKFQYDIWGDTVNTASRMESSGEVGKVNISQRTYELLKNHENYVFESRGMIEAKGKGEMEMWFVSLK